MPASGIIPSLNMGRFSYFFTYRTVLLIWNDGLIRLPVAVFGLSYHSNHHRCNRGSSTLWAPQILQWYCGLQYPFVLLSAGSLLWDLRQARILVSI